ncbi:MAG: Peroxiredoxin [Phycisphaerae bacterium]|nr:Peroxiredoxin [Phycisphaerae bacterium]
MAKKKAARKVKKAKKAKKGLKKVAIAKAKKSARKRAARPKATRSSRPATARKSAGRTVKKAAATRAPAAGRAASTRVVKSASAAETRVAARAPVPPKIAPLTPAVGEPAPDFALQDERGNTRTLSAYRGRTLVLYFYPKDDTPGCTLEACAFRDASSEFDALAAAIVGVSPDTSESHAAFAQKFSLPFTLLADPDHRVCEKYGVWREKNLYGETRMGVVRTTFVIDENGRVAQVFEGVRPDGHDREVLTWLRSRQPAPSIAPSGY